MPFEEWIPQSRSDSCLNVQLGLAKVKRNARITENATEHCSVFATASHHEERSCKVFSLNKSFYKMSENYKWEKNTYFYKTLLPYHEILSIKTYNKYIKDMIR